MTRDKVAICSCISGFRTTSNEEPIVEFINLESVSLPFGLEDNEVKVFHLMKCMRSIEDKVSEIC